MTVLVGRRRLVGARPRHRSGRSAPRRAAAGSGVAAAGLPTWTRRRLALSQPACSRPSARGCGARPPASRSSATSSTARTTTRPPVSAATSSGCATATATTCRCRRGSTRPAGPPGSATSWTTATGSSRARRSTTRSESAVTRLRLTNLPVALTVSHGNHGWILTGFRATADPAVTSSFKVTSVRVTGPLYGLQSKNGYDMPPNTKLTTAAAEALLHAVEVRAEADGLGRPLRVDPAGPVEPPPAAAAPEPRSAAPSVAPLASVVIDADDVVESEPSPPAAAVGSGQIAIAAPRGGRSGPAPAAPLAAAGPRAGGGHRGRHGCRPGQSAGRRADPRAGPSPTLTHATRRLPDDAAGSSPTLWTRSPASHRVRLRGTSPQGLGHAPVVRRLSRSLVPPSCPPIAPGG